jgi:aspartate carbamoyltransferase regulatory subunit
MDFPESKTSNVHVPIELSHYLESQERNCITTNRQRIDSIFLKSNKKLSPLAKKWQGEQDDENIDHKRLIK